MCVFVCVCVCVASSPYLHHGCGYQELLCCHHTALKDVQRTQTYLQCRHTHRHRHTTHLSLVALMNHTAGRHDRVLHVPGCVLCTPVSPVG